MRATPAQAAARYAQRKAARVAPAPAPRTEPFFPHVEVQLTGEDGNGFMIMGRVAKAMRRAGLQAEADLYIKEASSGNYDHLLQTTMKYVSVA